MSEPAPGSAFVAAVYARVAEIPRGRVATYGEVAAAVGRPLAARAVGQALKRLGAGTELPWWRVVNAQGRVSPRGGDGWPFAALQRTLLEREGVSFDAAGQIDLRRVGLRGL